MKNQLNINDKIESSRHGLGTILSIEGSYAMVDFNGETKRMMLIALKAPKAPKVKNYMKEETANTINFTGIVNNLIGSKSMRNSSFLNIFNEIEKIAMKQNHFASTIIEDARNGKTISKKQACVVAYFAQNNNLINL